MRTVSSQGIVEGLWQGIQAMGSWIKEKVSGFFGGIVNGVKGLLGIHSPSKVFADIGDNMALGLGEGFGNSISSVTKDIEKSIPTEFDPPTVKAPEAVNAVVPDVTYHVNPIVGDVNTPNVSDVTYGVTPVVGDFNPPDASAPEGEPEDDDNPNVTVPDPDTSGGTPPPAFAPVIQITVNGNADDETVENLRTSLRDEVRELFREFRDEEREQMTLKNQYAYG